MLFTLFNGAVGASLERDIDVSIRETAVAAEAFPHVEFWRELDIRWLRYSCTRAGVGRALRELKANFAQGKGQLSHVSIDCGAGGGGRSKRSRRGAGSENEDVKKHTHPVSKLLQD
jgi:hypothetical protein